MGRGGEEAAIAILFCFAAEGESGALRNGPQPLLHYS